MIEDSYLRFDEVRSLVR